MENFKYLTVNQVKNSNNLLENCGIQRIPKTVVWTCRDCFCVFPGGHHIQILSKCKNIEEAIFYIVHCASEGWSRQALMNCLKADYYHTSGSAITNFSEKLPVEIAAAIRDELFDIIKVDKHSATSTFS